HRTGESVQVPRVRRSQFERGWPYCAASGFCDAIEALARWRSSRLQDGSAQRLLSPGRQHDGSLRCQQPESEGLQKIQFNDCTGMTLVTDRNVLTDIQLKITTAGRDDEPAF